MKKKEMTDEDKLQAILEWAAKTQQKIEEIIYTLNTISDFLYEREGEVIYKVRPMEKKHEV